jgi:ribonuclease BN (tRNA processing enzyme)
MRLRIVGSSPAWPNSGGACSGHLVDDRLLLDCGPGVLAKLREREAWPTVEVIAITHLHLDHWGDLVPWVWGSLYGPGADLRRPKLWLPPGADATLESLLGRLGTDALLARAFDIEEYEDGRPFTCAGFRVTAHRVEHYELDAYGFRVEGERALAYSGDTGPCSGLIRIAQNAHLFLCEATLERSDSEGTPRGHLTPAEARMAQESAGAHRLLLTHRPQERPLPAGFELAYDGLELDV